MNSWKEWKGAVMTTIPNRKALVRLHDAPVLIQPNNFVNKSLSNWSVNPFMGCQHGCEFCYVPDTSVTKQTKMLGSYGVENPAIDWGRYLLVRPWDRAAFSRALRKAEETPLESLNPDGNRAVMYSTTTDPYQVIQGPTGEQLTELREIARNARRRSLEMIRDHSTLNVRILTRSPMAREDFELFASFGDRLMLGISLPTLDESLSQVYEPHVPGPKQRLKLLHDAHDAGLNSFVAVAPVFPECDYESLVALFEAVKGANPLTVFMEPVNIRLEVASRIQKSAARVGRDIDMSPFTDRDVWADYALLKLREAEEAARETGLSEHLHLWPDKALGAKKVVGRQPDPEIYLAWLNEKWSRISEWPGKKS